MGDLMKKLHEAADYVASKINNVPISIGMVLGSGLGDLANEVEDKIIIPYSEIPHFPVSTVVGHAGRLVIGKLSGKQVLVMQGRFHNYEGYPMDTVELNVRMNRL